MHGFAGSYIFGIQGTPLMLSLSSIMSKSQIRLELSACSGHLNGVIGFIIAPFAFHLSGYVFRLLN
jgi:hypothetical protein